MAALLLTACLSTQMKKMVGLPVQEAAIEYGQPSNVIDMPDGRRVFQFEKRESGYLPATTTTQGSVWGNTWSATSTTFGGHPIESKCTLTFYTRWDDALGAWVVTDYRVPKELVC